MRTGFYDLSKMNIIKLTEFFNDAIMLSYDTHIEILDVKQSWSRERCASKSIKEMLGMVSTINHNVCIDRSVQHSSEEYGEVGFSLIKSPDYFLYIYLSLPNLKTLVTKYNLLERKI